MLEVSTSIGDSPDPVSQRLLIVDDDTELTRLLTELLGHDGFEVEAVDVG